MTEMYSPHFSKREMTRTLVRLPNDPPPMEDENLRTLCRVFLEPLRAKTGPIRVSSGYRSPAVNTRVGGSDRSQHMKGEAVDFEALDPAWNHFRVGAVIVASFDFDQLIYEFTGPDGNEGWLHASYTHRRANRRSIKWAYRDFVGGRWVTRYLTLDEKSVPVSGERFAL